MDLEKILAQIKAETEREVESILADGQKQVDDLLQKAKDEVEGSRQRILQDAKYRQQRESALIMRQGIMQTLRMQAEARQKLIDAAMQTASEKLDKLYAREDYPSILNRFAREAVADLEQSLLPEQKVILRFDPKDQRVSIPKFKLEGHECELVYDLKTKGGCIAESEDRKVIVYNTIETRIKHGLTLLRQQMWQMFERKLTK